MPDKPAQDVSPEGAPMGRSDPGGGGKIFGFPWWVWGIAAVGTFGVVYLMKKKGTAPTTTDVTGSAGGNAQSGVTQTDPMTASALLQAMQDLATRLGASSITPPTATPGSSSGPMAGAAAYTVAQAVTTSHVTGGSDTARITSSGLPDAATFISKTFATILQRSDAPAAALSQTPDFIQGKTVAVTSPGVQPNPSYYAAMINAAKAVKSWLPQPTPSAGPAVSQQASHGAFA